MNTATIHAELDADERAALGNANLRALAKAALELAERVCPGSARPDPGLPGALYGKLIDQHARVARLRFAAHGGERPTGYVGGYFTADEIIRDATMVMRQAD